MVATGYPTALRVGFLHGVSRTHLRTFIIKEPCFLHGLQEFANVGLSDMMGDAKLLADSVDDLGFSLPLLQTFENQRAGEIEPKHPSALDVQNDRAVLVLCTTNSVGNLVH